jgi:hypothetical protein
MSPLYPSKCPSPSLSLSATPSLFSLSQTHKCQGTDLLALKVDSNLSFGWMSPLSCLSFPFWTPSLTLPTRCWPHIPKPPFPYLVSSLAWAVSQCFSLSSTSESPFEWCPWPQFPLWTRGALHVPFPPGFSFLAFPLAHFCSSVSPEQMWLSLSGIPLAQGQEAAPPRDPA